jgi:hypothetical protein
MTMKNTKFYPTVWQTIPYSFELVNHWEIQEKSTVDLTLNYTKTSGQKVSQMALQINGLAIIDREGKEHQLSESLNQAFDLKGMHTGHFITIKNTVTLPAGNYAYFRFYVGENGNKLYFSDGSSKLLLGTHYLDFEIESGLQLKKEMSQRIIFRFDFEPYTISNFLKSLEKQLKGFIRSKVTGSLAN